MSGAHGAGLATFSGDRVLEVFYPAPALGDGGLEAGFSEQLLESPLIDRLNLGPVPTMKISWDQPHEGNMFEFLWKRRSIERGW